MEWTKKTEYQLALDAVLDGYDYLKTEIKELGITIKNEKIMLDDLKVLRKEAIIRLEDHFK